jgi:hypothetical protein
MGNIKYSEIGSVSRKVVVGVAVLFVIVAVVLAVISSSKKDKTNPSGNTQNSSGVNTKDARNLSDDFIGAIAKNDPDKAWNIMSSRYQKQAGPKDAWESTVHGGYNKSNGTPSFEKMEKVTNATSAGSNMQAITYKTTIKGVNWTAIVYVSQENNTWKIQGMNVSQS